MKRTPDRDMLAQLRALAGHLELDAEDVIAATSMRQMWASPGNIVDGEKPLGVGSKLNLRREMPNGARAELDHGWFVAGYSRKKDGRWIGYVLVRPAGKLRPVDTNSMSAVEAFDLVEALEVLPQ